MNLHHNRLLFFRCTRHDSFLSVQPQKSRKEQTQFPHTMGCISSTSLVMYHFGPCEQGLCLSTQKGSGINCTRTTMGWVRDTKTGGKNLVNQKQPYLWRPSPWRGRSSRGIWWPRRRTCRGQWRCAERWLHPVSVPCWTAQTGTVPEHSECSSEPSCSSCETATVSNDLKQTETLFEILLQDCGKFWGRGSSYMWQSKGHIWNLVVSTTTTLHFIKQGQLLKTGNHPINKLFSNLQTLFFGTKNNFFSLFKMKIWSKRWNFWTLRFCNHVRNFVPIQGNLINSNLEWLAQTNPTPKHPNNSLQWPLCVQNSLCTIIACNRSFLFLKIPFSTIEQNKTKLLGLIFPGQNWISNKIVSNRVA